MSNNKKQWNWGKESLNLQNIGTVFKDIKKGGSYTKGSAKNLVQYVKKEENSFESKKSIDNMDLKHFVISPINPELYEKLNEEEKKLVKEESEAWTKKTFGRYGFVAGIEENSNKKGKGVKKGIHLHVAVNDKYKINGSVDMLRLREGMTRDFAEKLPKSTRDKLGLKNKKEQDQFFKEKKSNTQKQNHWNKVMNDPKMKEDMRTIQLLSKDMKGIFGIMKVQNTKRTDLKNMNRRHKSNILKNQDDLKLEMKWIKKSKERKDNEVKYLDSRIKREDEKMGIVESEYNKETIHLKEYLKDEEKSLNYYADGQHSMFKNIQKVKKKDGTISEVEYLNSISSNKNYWKWIKEDKRKEHEYYLDEQEKKFKDHMEWYKNNIKNYTWNKKFLEELKKSDSKRLDSKRKEYGSINEEKYSVFETFISNMDEITKTMDKLKEEQERKQVEKQKIQQDIQSKKEQVKKKIEDSKSKFDGNSIKSKADEAHEKFQLAQEESKEALEIKKSISIGVNILEQEKDLMGKENEEGYDFVANTLSRENNCKIREGDGKNNVENEKREMYINKYSIQREKIYKIVNNIKGMTQLPERKIWKQIDMNKFIELVKEELIKIMERKTYDFTLDMGNATNIKDILKVWSKFKGGGEIPPEFNSVLQEDIELK
ncbi:hypothetical protein [Sulfurimonas sp.]|uniref:hypothetical protein n=1 Tax=Sulfurimonas sp. TaxID=2022749 RepID=UPI0025EF1526|nr:hypothetical protein [Sulfurimonas sp.]MBW6487698.1 hypothetical protein [Sulfurimonas sp.]